MRPRLALSNVEKRDAAGGGGPAEACPPTPTPPMVPGYKLNQLEVFTRRGGLPLSCKLRPLMPDNSSEELEDEWDSSNPHPGGAGGGQEVSGKLRGSHLRFHYLVINLEALI